MIRHLSAAVFAACLLNAAPAEQSANVERLMEANHWKQARQIVAARLQSNPNDAQAHAWMSKIKSSFGDLDGALAEGEKAVTLDGSKVAYHGQLAEANALLADVSNPLKGYSYVRKMKKELEAAYAIDHNHVDTLLVDMMFSWKAPSIAGGDKQKAKRIAEQITSVSPSWGYLAQARLLESSGNDAAIESVLKKAVQANPSFYRARFNLATFYCCKATHKNNELAEKAALDAIALDPTEVGGYAILAQVYAREKRWSDLDALLVRAEKSCPEDLSPYYSAASALVETGQDFPRAERYVAKYTSQPVEGRAPSVREARTLLNTLHARQGGKPLTANLP